MLLELWIIENNLILTVNYGVVGGEYRDRTGEHELIIPLFALCAVFDDKFGDKPKFCANPGKTKKPPSY